jgi:hypothetical protein
MMYQRALHNLLLLRNARIPNEPNPISEHGLTPTDTGLCHEQDACLPAGASQPAAPGPRMPASNPPLPMRLLYPSAKTPPDPTQNTPRNRKDCRLSLRNC